MNAAIWIGVFFLILGALTPPALFAFSHIGALAPIWLAGYFLWPTFLGVGLVSVLGGLRYKIWKRHHD